MDLLDTLLQSVDRHTNLSNSNAINQLRVIRIEMMAEMMVVDEIHQVFGVCDEFLWAENRSLRYGTVNCVWSGMLLARVKRLRAVGQVRTEPIHHRSIDTEPFTEYTPHNVMVDSIEGGAEVEQHENTYSTRVDVTHKLVMNCGNRSLGRMNSPIC